MKKKKIAVSAAPLKKKTPFKVQKVSAVPPKVMPERESPVIKKYELIFLSVLKDTTNIKPTRDFRANAVLRHKAYELKLEKVLNDWAKKGYSVVCSSGEGEQEVIIMEKK